MIGEKSPNLVEFGKKKPKIWIGEIKQKKSLRLFCLFDGDRPNKLALFLIY